MKPAPWQVRNADAGQNTPIALFAVGLALVAGIGWLDDHRPLSARLRFSIHLIAAGLLAIALWRLGCAVWLVVAGFILAASLINIWNFMDGINGLAASQAAIAAAGFALVLPSGWSLLAMALCAGCLGFLPFNFPRARIFLGDVGSGALGYALAALTAMAAAQAASPILVLLPLTMFSIDAGFTLSRRVLSREPWWQPRRYARLPAHRPSSGAYQGDSRLCHLHADRYDHDGGVMALGRMVRSGDRSNLLCLRLMDLGAAAGQDRIPGMRTA